MSRPAKSVVEYRIYELDPARPFLCLSGEEWRISDVLSDRLHFHNCMEIGYCLSDSGFLGFEDGATVSFKARDIFLIPRFVPHTTCSDAGCRSLWSYLFLDPDALAPGGAQQASLGGLIGDYLRITPQSHPRLYFLCRCLLEEATAPGETDLPVFLLYASTLGAELRRLLMPTAQAAPSSRNRAFALRPALEYVNDHYMEPCNIGRLAGLCHLSQTHFRRLFLSIMGTSPLQYVIQLRIRQACVLLSISQDPITSVAQAVGINSISSFNRNFQQIMGVSPQQYRAAVHPRAARGLRRILPAKGWLAPENL